MVNQANRRLDPAPTFTEKAAAKLSDLCSPTVAKVLLVSAAVFLIVAGIAAGVALGGGIGAALVYIGVEVESAVLLGMLVGFIPFIAGVVLTAEVIDISSHMKYATYASRLFTCHNDRISDETKKDFKSYSKYIRHIDFSRFIRLSVKSSDVINWLRVIAKKDWNENAKRSFQEFLEYLHVRLNPFGRLSGQAADRSQFFDKLRNIVERWSQKDFANWKRDPDIHALMLSLEPFRNQVGANIYDGDVAEIIGLIPKLDSINLGKNITPKTLHAIKSLQINKLTLDLSDFLREVPDKELAILFPSLTIENRIIEMLKHIPNSVTHLILKTDLGFPLNEQFFKHLLNYCPQIQKLMLNECPKEVLDLINLLPDFKKLQIRTSPLNPLLRTVEGAQKLCEVENIKRISFRFDYTINPLNANIAYLLRKKFYIYRFNSISKHRLKLDR